MKFTILLTAGLFLQNSLAATQPLESTVSAGWQTVSVGEYLPSAPPIGTVLYFHGFGDSFRNHTTLFSEWLNAGFKVVGFDLPSHGKSRGKSLNFYKMGGIQDIIRAVFDAKLKSDSSPVVVAGYSLGGLIALRAVQENKIPRVHGLILYAPALTVPTLVGDNGTVTNPTLTHSEHLWKREVKPDCPLKLPLFGIHVLKNADEAWWAPLPSHLPVLFFAAGSSEDRYVNTDSIMQWPRRIRENHPRVTAYQCQKARHELDNEPESFGGAQVRKLSARFAQEVIGKVPFVEMGVVTQPCKAF
jgi:alpha-beta hydrolase superfamily lysophospholipase